MPVFLISSPSIDNGTLTITGPLADHLRKSLRVRRGDELTIGDERRIRYTVRVLSLSSEEIRAHIVDEQRGPARRTPKIALGQSMIKGERMDWLIQKVTELGVDAIVPLITERVVVRPQIERIDHQLERWRRIALEAAQQSERWDVPVLTQPIELADWLQETRPGESCRMLLSERAGSIGLSHAALPSDSETEILLAVGPEGGWTDTEHRLALEAHFTPVTLGPNILRTETAAIAAVTMVRSKVGALG